jgi:uncharacterized protein with HEPN domain
MKRDIKLYLHDIRESIMAREDYIGTFTEDEFYKNRQVQDAILRRLEIIGEAVKNIDEPVRSRYPDIPWKKIAGMRDVVIHEYFGVSLKRIWNVVKKDLPDLKQKILLIKENKDS